MVTTTKETWRMTREQFIREDMERYLLDAKAIGFKLNESLQRKLSGEQHEKIVRKAVSTGKPVSPEVLKDYPDLAQGAKVAPAVEITKAETVKYPSTQAGAEARAKAEGIPISEASRFNAEEALKTPTLMGRHVEIEVPAGTQIQVRPQSKSRGIKSKARVRSPKQPFRQARRGALVKGKAHVTKRPREKSLTLAQLHKIERGRSQRSQSSDLSQRHSTVVTPSSSRVKTWLVHPGRMDIMGVDTPKGTPLPKNKGQTPRDKEPLTKEHKLIHARARLPSSRPRGKITRR